MTEVYFLKNNIEKLQSDLTVIYNDDFQSSDFYKSIQLIVLEATRPQLIDIEKNIPIQFSHNSLHLNLLNNNKRLLLISWHSSSMQTKLIPFKQIKPVKFMGINGSLPFTSLIGQSKLIYFCGRSIIMQNIKTYEQKIIWTNEFVQQPQVIEHIINIHRENIVGIAVKDDSQTNMVIIMNINSQINNYEHLNKKEREKDRMHYLKNIEGDDKIIQKIRFLHEGSLFAVIVSDRQVQINTKIIHIYSSLSGDLLYSNSFQSSLPLIQGLQLNKHNYICLIKNQPDNHVQDAFMMVKRVMHSFDQTSKSSRNIKQKADAVFFKVSLINSSQLSSKSDFLIELHIGETILQVKFFQTYKKTIAFFLLSSGFVVIFMVNQRGFHDSVRVDVRIDKCRYLSKIKEQQQKMHLVSEKTQNQQQNVNLQINSSTCLKQQNNIYTVNKDTEKLQVIQKNYNHTTCKISSFMQLKKTQSPCIQGNRSSQKIKNDPTKYFYPTCISCTSCKVIIGYEKCSFIGLISYSAVDQRKYNYRYIHDFFYEKNHIDSIRKINFSQDGCHCSVLAKVIANRVEPSKKNKNSTKIQNKYKLIQKQFLNQSLKPQKEQYLSLNKRKQKHAMISSTATANGIIEAQQKQQQKQHFQVFHIDFISGIIEHEYHSEAIEQSLTKTSLKGTVKSMDFNQMNNTMLILMMDGSLYYYHLNMTNVNSEKDYLNAGARSSLVTLRRKLQANDFFKQKSISNYLSPDSILLWVKKIKSKPFLIVCHPIVFQLILVFQDNVKFHFYNHDKMFQSHHVLSLKNCKAASYSPYGDKLALGTVGSIWLVDSYTHQIIKKIPLVIFPTSIKKVQTGQKSQGLNAPCSQTIYASLSSKTVSKIQYINNQDIILQTGNTTLSMLLNYDKVLYYGSTSEQALSSLICYDYKHRLGVVAYESCVKIITKCNINSKNKCEELAKIDLVVTAIKLCGQIDTLFMGGSNGVLYFIRWPQFFQNDNIKTSNTNDKLHLFHSPIVSIQISRNYRQLFVTSKQGTIIICQLSHSDQVQKVGKDVSFRMSKKIDLTPPLLNKWLVSTCDQQKRAQNITKLMGNQAQIAQKKNNEIILAEQYKNRLQQRSCASKQELQQRFKSAIKKYEIDSGISKLQIQIAFVRDEIRRVSGRRQVQSKQTNQKIDLDLHEIFSQRQKLQNQLKQLQAKSAANKSDFILHQESTRLTYQHMTSQQLKQQDQNLKQSESMYQQKHLMNKAIQENVRLDFMDEKQEFEKHYNKILKESYLNNNVLMAENRNKNVEISQITDKMRELSARMNELETDFGELQQEKQRVELTKGQFCHQIIQTDKKYHNLIKKTKQLQTNLKKIRSTSQACQMKYDDLQTQLQGLSQKWKYLQERKEEAQIDFGQQFKIRNHNSKHSQEVKQKIQQLKQKRKHSFDNNMLLKNLIKMYSPIEHQNDKSSSFAILCDKSTGTGQQQQTNQPQSAVPPSIIEQKKSSNTKLTSDLQKWSHVKDDNKTKFIKYNQKLQEQNNKLIYQFNQLQKEFKDYQKVQKKLLNDITVEKYKLKLKLKQQLNLKKLGKDGQNQRQSQKNNNFLACAQNQSKMQNKIQNNFQGRIQRTSVSLHRQTLSQQKLASTSYHCPSPKSLFRQSKYQPLNCVFKPKNNQKMPQLNKASSKNFCSLMSENKKREIFKQLKKNEGQLQHKYHGVTLDKNTLKPKKTMCISFHRQGENQGKFVTQY